MTIRPELTPASYLYIYPPPIFSLFLPTENKRSYFSDPVPPPTWSYSPFIPFLLALLVFLLLLVTHHPHTQRYPHVRSLYLFLWTPLGVLLFVSPPLSSFFFFFVAALGLHCCMQAFSSCGEQGLLLLWSTGSRRAGSVVVAHGPSCSAACGVFPDQGSNPCPLHWQEDS